MDFSNTLSSLQHKWFVAAKKMAEDKLVAAPQLMHSFCRAQGVSEAALQRVLDDINLLEVHLGGAYTDAELAAAAGSVRRACVEGSTWSSCIVQRPFFPRKRSGRGRTVQADGLPLARQQQLRWRLLSSIKHGSNHGLRAAGEGPVKIRINAEFGREHGLASNGTWYSLEW